MRARNLYFVIAALCYIVQLCAVLWWCAVMLRCALLCSPVMCRVLCFWAMAAAAVLCQKATSMAKRLRCK